MSPILIAGCGDIGLRLMTCCHGDQIRDISGIVASGRSCLRLQARGARAIQHNLDDPVPDGLFPTRDAWVFYFIPPPREGRSDPRIQNFLASIPKNSLPKKLIYISSSAVYGCCQGEWVNEDRSPAPGTDRGKRRLAAEQKLQRWSQKNHVDVNILRVPAIYGPGRLPIKRLRNGLPVVDEKESAYINRIHADDLATICLAAAKKGVPGAVYNASDGHPCTMSEYLITLADMLGFDAPPVISFDEAQEQMSPGMLAFIKESKRLDNNRMLKELDIRLRYPDMSKGLMASIEAMNELEISRA